MDYEWSITIEGLAQSNLRWQRIPSSKDCVVRNIDFTREYAAISAYSSVVTRFVSPRLILVLSLKLTGVDRCEWVKERVRLITGPQE